MLVVYLDENEDEKEEKEEKKKKTEKRSEKEKTTEIFYPRYRFQILVRLRHKLRELMADAMPRDDNDSQQYPGVIALDLTFILRRSSTAVNPLLTIIFVGSDKESYRQNEQARLNLKAVSSTLRSVRGTSVWERREHVLIARHYTRRTYTAPAAIPPAADLPFLQKKKNLIIFHNLFTTTRKDNFAKGHFEAVTHDVRRNKMRIIIEL